MRKRGRPVGSVSSQPVREVRKQLRWTAAEWKEIEAAARAAGETVTVYQRRKILDRFEP